MALVKVKKEMNLAQLIEWAWDNDIRNKGFESERTSRAYFDYDGYLSCTRAMEPTDTFTVEVEEEITEYTKLYLVERYISSYEDYKLKYKSHQNKSINSVLKNNMPHIKTTHFYTEVNNELILIWKNGKLVE